MILSSRWMNFRLSAFRDWFEDQNYYSYRKRYFWIWFLQSFLIEKESLGDQSSMLEERKYDLELFLKLLKTHNSESHPHRSQISDGNHPALDSQQSAKMIFAEPDVWNLDLKMLISKHRNSFLQQSEELLLFKFPFDFEEIDSALHSYSFIYGWRFI